jgi:hypothetical protein
MFDPETERATEQRRSRLILGFGAIGAIALALVIVIFLARPQRQSRELANIRRAGSPEFEAYKDKVTLEDPETLVYPNQLGMNQFAVHARLHNRGQRTLTAVEILGKVYDLRDQVVAQATSVPIPRVRREPLKPGESMPITVRIDTPAKVKEADVKDVKIELQGLRFQ